MIDPKRCSESTWARFNSFPCQRMGKYNHNGKLYCKQHHPPEIERKDKERKAKWDKEWEQKEQEWRRGDACLEYCKNLNVDELEKRINSGKFAL